MRVRYTHPQLGPGPLVLAQRLGGKTVYEGTLQLKFIGTCTSQLGPWKLH